MRWQKKGCEFDELGQQLIADFKNRKEVFVFGAGLYGQELQEILSVYECFGGFIDNDKRKQEQGVNGYRVISLDEYIASKKNAWIVVAVSNKYNEEMVRQLSACQLSENYDYFTYKEFVKKIFPVLSVYYYGKVYVELTQISVTERCTLKCRKCAHGCGYVSRDTKDMELSEVCNSADSFFETVDFIKEFVLIGGEPLLYNKLAETVEYIGQKYREKMYVFSITTNGTLLPTEELLNVCRKYNVLFRISNYSKQNPHLKQKYKKLEKLLKDNDIKYILGREEQEWMDYGFDYLNRKGDELELTKVFDACRTPCSEIRGNKYHYCVMARSVSENMNFCVGKDDYLDLTTLNGENGKKIMLEYTMGYSDKGYMDMCNYCHGAEAVQHPILAAEQMKDYCLPINFRIGEK